MPRGCFGACGCLAGTARAVVDSPLGCCCNRTRQRRFLEYFSRFQQVQLQPTSDGGAETNNAAAVENNSSRQGDSMRVTSTRCDLGKRPNLRLLVCTANLGNEQPDAESIAKWIPPDGFFVEDPVASERIKEENGSDEDDDDLNLSEHTAIPYQTKYPIRQYRHHDIHADEDDGNGAHDDDDDDENEDDENEDAVSSSWWEQDEKIIMDALSKQLDLIVIGLQEATFDPPKSASASEGSTIRIRVPKVKTLKKLQTLRAAKDFSSRREDSDWLKLSSTRSTQLPDYLIPTGLQTILRDEWEDGTHALHSLFQGRLPSYTRLVSYQRGQMRLVVYGRTETTDPIGDPVLPVQVLYTAAQNTGRAGLANKGGIVTEILVNGCTRLSFVSCHLEAHEGTSKYAIRCQTLADILRGTSHRKKLHTDQQNGQKDEGMNSSAHHVIPSLHSLHSSSSQVAIDVSLTSHYSFVLGDLNFRTDLSYMDPTLAEKEYAHKNSIFNMVKAQDWNGLNDADELHRALRKKDCLVGFRTLHCNFPPTFKMARQAGYEYIDKRRPSYTDRVLFKTGHKLERGLRPMLYEPIDDFTTSDHKPVRAAFAVDLNSPFRARPRAVRNPSMRWQGVDNDAVQIQQQSSRRRFVPRFRMRAKEQNDDASVSSHTSHVVDISSGQGHGRTGDNLRLFVSNITVVLDHTDNNFSSHGIPSVVSAPNPYLLLMTQPEEAIRLPTWNNGKRLRRILHRIGIGRRASMTERTKDGWPCTSAMSNTHVADWGEEEIACSVMTHTQQGGSIDLSGAILFLTVMNGGAEDTVLGTVTFNLVDLIKTAAKNRNLPPGSRPCFDASSAPSQARHRKVRKSVFDSIFVGRKEKPRSERGGSSFFGMARSNSRIEDEDDDPIASVEINEPLLKDGVEVGTLHCVLESWWMDEGAARIVRVPEVESRAVEDGSRRGLLRRSPTGSIQKLPPTRKAEKRHAVLQHA